MRHLGKIIGQWLRSGDGLQVLRAVFRANSDVERLMFILAQVDCFAGDTSMTHLGDFLRHKAEDISAHFLSHAVEIAPHAFGYFTVSMTLPMVDNLWSQRRS